MKTALIAALTLAAAACGGTSRSDSTKPSDLDQSGQKHDMAHKGEPGMGMPPEIARFHDTLAPRWHAKQGPQRMTDTCTAMPQFHADAEAVVASQPPSGGDPAAWSAGGKQLSAAVDALDAACKANDAAGFEPAFERVHEAFHGVMAAAGGKHDEHGKHDEGGKHDEHDKPATGW
jgi:hypothetical protein